MGSQKKRRKSCPCRPAMRSSFSFFKFNVFVDSLLKSPQWQEVADFALKFMFAFKSRLVIGLFVVSQTINRGKIKSLKPRFFIPQPLRTFVFLLWPPDMSCLSRASFSCLRQRHRFRLLFGFMPHIPAPPRNSNSTLRTTSLLSSRRSNKYIVSLFLLSLNRKQRTARWWVLIIHFFNISHTHTHSYKLFSEHCKPSLEAAEEFLINKMQIEFLLLRCSLGQMARTQTLQYSR